MVIESINNALPKIMSDLQSDLTETGLENLVSSAVVHMKKEIMASVNKKFDEQAKKITLKTLSETELLGTYNRRDNIKILGVPENITVNNDGKKNFIKQSRKFC